MKLKIAITLLITLLFTGCFKEEGQIRITSDVENAIIYIDGDKKGMTGDGYTTIIIEEGDHKVRIYKEKDEEWFYEGKQDVFVGANSSVKVKINTEKKQTKARVERLAREKKERKERLIKEKQEKLVIEERKRKKKLTEEKQARKKLVKKYALSSYPKGTFYDVDTKLMWQDNEDAKNIEINWEDSKDYCKNLSIGEYSDWRLPEYIELLSIIIDIKKDTPATTIKSGLTNVASGYYWSSSEHLSDSEVSGNSNAWSVHFNGGYGDNPSKLNENYVRCVRGKLEW